MILSTTFSLRTRNNYILLQFGPPHPTPTLSSSHALASWCPQLQIELWQFTGELVVSTSWCRQRLGMNNLSSQSVHHSGTRECLCAHWFVSQSWADQTGARALPTRAEQSTTQLQTHSSIISSFDRSPARQPASRPGTYAAATTTTGNAMTAWTCV